MSNSLVLKLNDATDEHVQQIGGKAANLAKLIRAGLPVPDGIAVGLGSFDNNGKLTDTAKAQIKAHLQQSKPYAVRSSALAEDAKGASWAGQFETFLETKADDVIAKVEDCHNSAKDRAKAYAAEKSESGFDVAVVIQEMVDPEYAGVLFTRDPVTGMNHLVTEYVEGLGEALVSGRADPVKVVLDGDERTPFNSRLLAELAIKIEKLFGAPQDIEWTSVKDRIWIVQARPITVTSKSRQSFYLGKPNDLFYWGPSRAKTMYMNDFMAGVQRLFEQMATEPSLPTPPKTLVLFDEGKMVWLNNAVEFTDFTEKVFHTYKKLNRLDHDIKDWHHAKESLSDLSGQVFEEKIVNAWYHTEFAEFALYGAEAYISKQLARFDERTLPKIWGTFTIPDEAGFLTTLDNELAESKDTLVMAMKYPWIRDGYAGPNDEAQWYFERRLEAIKRDGLLASENNETKRQAMIREYGLTEDEVQALAQARKLAEFMDERKKWMMQTRRLIQRTVGDIEHGWFFADGQSTLIGEDDSHELWQRYVSFKSSLSAVKGNVANTGGKHFLTGEVRVLDSHIDPVENDMILVVPSTSPGWVPLMRHARALITDHGGMMSHAAIVAREFNVPCIVGTIQGTKILKDGDKVVLDLVKGEISK